MRSTTVLSSVISLFTFFCGCRKDDKKTVLETGLRGKILYTSCATTAVQVFNNNDIGSEWTNCHNQQTYQNVIDVFIPELNRWPIEGEFIFDIIQHEPHARCFMADCGPAKTYTIVIRKS